MYSTIYLEARNNLSHQHFRRTKRSTRYFKKLNNFCCRKLENASSRESHSSHIPLEKFNDLVKTAT